MDGVSLSELRSIGADARANQPAVHGYCYPTSKAIVRELLNRDGWSKRDAETRQVRLQANPNVKHEVATVRASKVTDADASGVVIVDATLDQYCTQNKETGKVRVALDSGDALQEVYVYETIESAPYYFG